MYDVVSAEERSGERERIVTTHGAFPREAPPFLLFPSASVGGLPFPSPSLRNNQLLLFFLNCCLWFCFCCSDETFFLMLKLLLVFCDGCSALSFLLSGVSPLQGRGEDGRRRFGWSSRAVVPKLGVWQKSEGSQDDHIDGKNKKSFLFHKIMCVFPDFSPIILLFSFSSSVAQWMVDSSSNS